MKPATPAESTLALLSRAAQTQAEDAVLAPGHPPLLRIRGAWSPLSGAEPVSEDALRALAEHFGGGPLNTLLQNRTCRTFVRDLDGHGRRVRATLSRHPGGVCVALRFLAAKPPVLADQHPPACLAGLLQHQAGCLFFAGAAASGRSHLVAACVEELAEASRRILFLGSPPEFAFSQHPALVEVQDLGDDPRPVAEILSSVPGRDIRVVAIDTPLDSAGLQEAFYLAQSGVLVLLTLDGTTAGEVLKNLIDRFPEEKRQLARGILAETLVGLVIQLLIPRADNQGFLPLHEILLRTRPIVDPLREGKWEALSKIIGISRHEGMQLSADALDDAVQKNLITGEAAFQAARYKTRFLAYGPLEWRTGAT
jgi:twitching motility protein PilT